MKKEAEARLKYYKAIHMSNLYKCIIAKGGKELWQKYLFERFEVESCKDLNLITLKNFADSIYKKHLGSKVISKDDKIISIVPYLKNQKNIEDGTEKATTKQLWLINRRWEYILRYLKDNAKLSSYIKRVCGKTANFESLTKAQASKVITAINNWIKSIEG